MTILQDAFFLMSTRDLCPRLDSEMPEGVEVINSTLLFLRPLHRNDSGVYRCEVANDINLRSRDVRILIQGEHAGTQLTPSGHSSPRKC